MNLPDKGVVVKCLSKKYRKNEQGAVRAGLHLLQRSRQVFAPSHVETGDEDQRAFYTMAINTYVWQVSGLKIWILAQMQ
jgi:hypothetical protein